MRAVLTAALIALVPVAALAAPEPKSAPPASAKAADPAPGAKAKAARAEVERLQAKDKQAGGLSPADQARLQQAMNRASAFEREISNTTCTARLTAAGVTGSSTPC